MAERAHYGGSHYPSQPIDLDNLIAVVEHITEGCVHEWRFIFASGRRLVTTNPLDAQNIEHAHHHARREYLGEG